MATTALPTTVKGPLSQNELSGFTQEFHQNIGAKGQAAAQQKAQPHYAKGLGGFVERNLPTIGGIAGGIATAPLEALDAVSGVGGTALNVAGAGAGSALGQKLQNELTGNTASTKGAAVSGSIGQLAGDGLGKLVGKGAGLLTRPVDKGVANIATKKAANEALNEVSPFASVAKGKDVEGSVNLMKNLGMDTTPESMHTAANLTTGKTGEFNNTLRQILGGNGGEPIRVNVGNYLNHTKDAIDSEPLLGMAGARDGSGAKLMQSITKNKENNLFGGEGSLTQDADGNDVLDAIQYHQGQAANYAKSAPGTEGEAIGNVHKQAASYLEDRLANSAGADKAVASHSLEPDEAQAIKDNVESNGGSPQLGQHIVDTINNAKSVKDLRSSQAPFVNADKLASSADEHARGPGFVKALEADAAEHGSGGSGFKGYSSALEGASLAHGNVFAGIPLAYKAGKSEPVVNAASKVISPFRAINDAPQNVLNKLTRGAIPTAADERVANSATTRATNGERTGLLSGANSGASNTLGKLGIKFGAQSAAQDINQGAPKEADTTIAPTSYEIKAAKDDAAEQAANDPSSDTSGGDSSAGDPFSADSIKQSIIQDIQANGGKNISSLISLYNTFGKAADTQSTAEKNTTDNLNSALATLSTYSDQLNSSGGGRGKLGGTAENLLGKYGLGGGEAANVRAIESQKTDVATTIAKALTNGKPASTQIKSWEDALPNVTDSPAVAKQKLANITASIQAKLQTVPSN